MAANPDATTSTEVAPEEDPACSPVVIIEADPPAATQPPQNVPPATGPASGHDDQAPELGGRTLDLPLTLHPGHAGLRLMLARPVSIP